SVFLLLIVPSMIISFFALGSEGISFPVAAFSLILRDIAPTSLVVFFLWQNAEPLTLIGWKFKWPEKRGRHWSRVVRARDDRCSVDRESFPTPWIILQHQPTPSISECERSLANIACRFDGNRSRRNRRNYFSRLSDSAL